MESAKRAARVKQLETELEKKNKAIIDREKERQEMSRKVEEVEASKEKLVKELQNGKHQENIKASYEKPSLSLVQPTLTLRGDRTTGQVLNKECDDEHC